MQNQTTLYFIRHGETPSNAHQIKQGIVIDDYLDTNGVLQVEKVAPLVEHLNLNSLYTSYLHRAEETAAIIDKRLKAPVPIFHDFRLRERDFGSLTGKSEEQWLSAIPDYMEKERLQVYDYSPFDGESVEGVRQRVLAAILDIIKNNESKNVGVITHDGVIRLLLFHFPEIPRIYRGVESDKQVANTDIYEWEITDSHIENIKSLLK